MRAFNPWPVAETRFTGEQLRIWEAEAIESPREAPAARRSPAGTVLAHRRRHRCGLRQRRLADSRAATGRPQTACRPSNFEGTRLAGARFAVPMNRRRRRARSRPRMRWRGCCARASPWTRRLQDALAAADPQARAVGAFLELRRGARLLPARGDSGRLLSQPVGRWIFWCARCCPWRCLNWKSTHTRNMRSSMPR